jgi:hypothetical protein
MSAFTLIDGERAVAVEARVRDGRVWLDPGSLRDTLGWEYHDGQLCSDATCIPIPDGVSLVGADGVELGAFARALDRPLAVDLDEQAACLGVSARERAHALASQHAPDFTLRDLAGRPHSLSEHRGTKILLVAWASW